MQAMKTNHVQSRFSDHHILTGLLALGILLAAFIGYTSGRTSAADAPGQRISSHPSGNVMEAWVRRIDGPTHGSDHAHDVRIDSAGNVIVTGWIETATVMRIVTR